MEWTNELVLEFLDLYKNEPVIWNQFHIKHKDRNEVYDGWKRIQMQFSVKCTVTELKKKKDSLMASFRTCLNKVKVSMKYCKGNDDIFKPNWFAYEKMANFLIDKDQPKESINSEESITSEDTQMEECEETEVLHVSADVFHVDDPDKDENYMLTPSSISKTQSNISFKKRISSKGSSLNNIIEPTNKKLKFINVNEEPINKTVNILKDIADKLITLQHKDEFQLFGETIATHLKKLPENIALECQADILNYLVKKRLSHNSVISNPTTENLFSASLK